MSIKDHVNHATKFRRRVMREVVTAYNKGCKADDLDRIPYNLFPREYQEDNYRCCIYKDREVIKHRCIAALGIDLQSVTDDFLKISHYADIARKREVVESNVLTVLDIACESCIRAQYVISELCRGCIARPCVSNCPVECITVTNHQARIDPDKCINCGKCKEVCPYHAVVRVPVPCEEACPVEAIKRNPATGKQQIDFEKCTSCGRCMRACPFGAIMEKSQLIDVLEALNSEKEVIAMCAPAIAGQFSGGMGCIAAGLQRLGFDRVVEVASGADETCQHEAAEFVQRVMKDGESFMTTSCCPAYVEAATKHMPEVVPHISHTPTPMHYIAAKMREEYPEAVTVFVGPCVAKRFEGVLDEAVDYVLTFEEVGAMFEASNIETSVLDEVELEGEAYSEGRGFALVGGVAGAVQNVADDPEAVKSVLVNGLSLEGLNQLRGYARNGCPEGNLVEVMTCEGGCINGAGVYTVPDKAHKAIVDFAGSSAHLKK